MLKRVCIIVAVILLIASATLVLWQGSFNVGSLLQPDPAQINVFFALSILIFLLMLGLGFYLIRLMITLWIARQVDRTGSRIRTRLVMGALVLSVMPVFFMVLFGHYVLNRTLGKWFTQPALHAQSDFTTLAEDLENERRGRAMAEAQLLATSPEASALLDGSGAVKS